MKFHRTTWHATPPIYPPPQRLLLPLNQPRGKPARFMGLPDVTPSTSARQRDGQAHGANLTLCHGERPDEPAWMSVGTQAQERL